MKIIIPMAGAGVRFVNEGYADPKPFIKADGKMMVEYVCDMFDKENDEFVFVCNNSYMDTSYYKGLLQGVVKHSKVEIIDQHKLGAVWSVLSVVKNIMDEEEVIIAHCDTSCALNYNKFRKFVKDVDGCIVSNMGFHPHTLSKTVFAHSKIEGDRVLEIKEKAFYTDRFKDHASCGVYYFKKGAYVKKYFQQLMDEKRSHNGEYYVTLVFNLLIQDGLDVRSYLVDKVISLGTPNDLRHFEAWMTIEKGGQIDNEMDLLLCHRYWEGYVNNKS